MIKPIVALLLLMVLSDISIATAQTVGAQNDQESHSITLSRMGLEHGITLRGGQQESGIAFYLPRDVLVDKAEFTLNIKAIEPIDDPSMFLNILLNGETIGSIPIDDLTHQVTSKRFSVNTILMTSRNQLMFKISGSENEWVCQRDEGIASAIQILPTSAMKVHARPLSISAGLSSFPEPFWGKRDMLDRPVTFVFGPKINRGTIASAVMLASWFGTKSSYLGVSFDVKKNRLPLGNGIVFGRPGEQIGALTLPKVKQPTLKIIANPNAQNSKLLLVIGDSQAALRAAVYRLTQGGFPTKTYKVNAEMQHFNPRQPYDAPNWIDTDKVVYLKQLLQQGSTMKTSGIWHRSIHFSFRAAPDLFMWQGDTIPLIINYSFPETSWLDEDKSALNVTFNGKYINDLIVNKSGVLEKIWSYFGGSKRQEHSINQLQPYKLYGDNELSLYFNLKAKADTPCEVKYNTRLISTVKPSSYIDLRQTHHFSQLPELSFFVGASFPFSKMADYSHTALLLPEHPKSAQIKALLGLSSRAGASTGAMLTQATVYLGFPSSHRALVDKNVLAVTSFSERPFLNRILKNSPFLASDSGLRVKSYSWFEYLKKLIRGDINIETKSANRYLASLENWRGFVSFESPWSSGKTTVVAIASTNKQLAKLPNDLTRNRVNADIRHDLAIITEKETVKSFQVTPLYTNGQLSWYQQLRWYASEYIVLLSLFAIALSFILGLVLFKLLSRRANARSI